MVVEEKGDTVKDSREGGEPKDESTHDQVGFECDVEGREHDCESNDQDAGMAEAAKGLLLEGLHLIEGQIRFHDWAWGQYRWGLGGVHSK